MKKKLTLTLLALAAVSINLHAASSALPAPLPEFMNQEQLAKWNADQAAAQTTTSTAPESANQFYTGKPYVADAGGYIYKYRTYNPEMSRWTSADPSGFPDGVNNHVYAPTPTTQLDIDGLALAQGTGTTNPNLTANNFVTAGLHAVNAAVNGGLAPSVFSTAIGLVEDFVNNTVPSIDLSSSNPATFTGTANDVSGSWTNPGMVATGNFGSTYNINMTISGVGLVGSLAYSVTYNMSGDATLSNETQTTATDSANWVPVITATLSLNAAPGVGLGGTGNAGATAFSASFNINE